MAKVKVQRVGENSYMVFELLSYFQEERNPHDVYRSNKFGFSRATFYRRLDKLKELGLVEWRVGKARLTDKGLKILAILNNNRILIENSDKDVSDELTLKSIYSNNINQNDESRSFRLYEADKLKEIIDDSFIYVDYSTASYILKALLVVAGVDDKGLKTNVEKFKRLKEANFKVKLAINHFENASKQVLVFLDELVKLGKISALFVGVKNERKALSNKKLVVLC